MKAYRPLLALFVALPASWSTVSAAGFTVTGNSSTSQTLSSGTGSVTATGHLAVTGNANAVNITGSSTLVNSGVIEQTSNGGGRAVRDNAGGLTLSFTNNLGALVQAQDSDAFQMNKANSNVVLDNYGTFNSINNSLGGSQAIDWNAITTGSNTLNNFSTGLLQANAADAVRPGVNGVINNFGTIRALPVTEGGAGARTASSSDGIDAQANSGVQVANTGSISGRHGLTGGETASNFVISVNNGVGGTITGLNGSGINIDGATTNVSVAAFATVVNNGTITGNFDSSKYDIGDGDGVDVDGLVNLTNNGIIRGVGAGGAGNNSEGVSVGGGTIVNNAGAEISGQNPAGTGAEGHGILADDSNGGSAFAATNVTNSGLIRGYSGFAIKTIGGFDNAVTNNAGGIIQGAGTGAAIQLGSGNDTVINRGAIVGENGSAVDLGAGNNTFRIEGGSASIVGNVSGGSATSALIIDPGLHNTFTYAGAFSNFGSTEIKSGTVILSGVSTYAGPTLVSGGKLVATNVTGSATGSGLVTLKNQAILAGTGKIGGDVVVESGGIIAPGLADGSAGKLTIEGKLSLAPGARFAFDLASPAGVSDQIVIGGPLFFTAAGKAFFDFNNLGVGVGLYTLLTFDETTGGLDLSRFDFGTPVDFTANFVLTSTSLALNVTAVPVPEPAIAGSVAAGLMIAAAIGWRTRRRRAVVGL
jgi:hypothetical protein